MRAEIFKQLKSTDGFVSGESLGAAHGVTRAALWKHIKAMQSDGACIESAAGKGYRLISPPNVPRAEYVRAYLTADADVFYSPSVTSTNDMAKQAAQEGRLNRAVFIAGTQTAGRGRKGRAWQSPGGSGLYMTFLVRPQIDAARVSGLTIMAAVALVRAIETAAGVQAQIKWPNDILIAGKKLAGILTESMIGMDGVEFVVCGMGINVSGRFSGKLADKACALGAHADGVNPTLLAAAVIDTFFDAYDVFVRDGLGAFMPDFREYSVVSGTVTVISPTRRVTGTFAGYDESGAILIDHNGEMLRFIAGEVSLRGEDDYV